SKERRDDPWQGVWVAFWHADLYPCRPEWKIERAVSAHDGLFYIYKGFGWLKRDGERFDMEPGDLFITRRGPAYELGHEPHRPVTVYSAGFILRGPGNADALRRHVFPDRLRLPNENR